MLIHHVTAALRAHALFTRDVTDYIVKDNGEVIIVDEHTGRTCHAGPSLVRWSAPSHNGSERCADQNENQTLASITSRTTSVCMKSGGDDWYC
ncbi:hypothetical protein DMI65_20340 [Escherichia coli]|nr:hypothetical protein [Escherichia coli]